MAFFDLFVYLALKYFIQKTLLQTKTPWIIVLHVLPGAQLQW